MAFYADTWRSLTQSYHARTKTGMATNGTRITRSKEESARFVSYVFCVAKILAGDGSRNISPHTASQSGLRNSLPRCPPPVRRRRPGWGAVVRHQRQLQPLHFHASTMPHFGAAHRLRMPVGPVTVGRTSQIPSPGRLRRLHHFAVYGREHPHMASRLFVPEGRCRWSPRARRACGNCTESGVPSSRAPNFVQPHGNGASGSGWAQV